MKFVFAIACALVLLFGCIQDAVPPIPAKLPPIPLKTKPVEKKPVAQEGREDAGEPVQNATVAQGATQVGGLQNVSQQDAANETNGTEEEFDPSKLQVDYYFSPLCPFSISLSPKMKEWQQVYENSSQWHRFDVLTAAGYESFDRMAIENGLPNSSRVVPLAVIGKKGGNRVLLGIVEISQSLEGELRNWTSAS